MSGKRKRHVRKSLGTVERHKVERWITTELKDAIWHALGSENPALKIAVADQLVRMLATFQDRGEG